MLLLSVGAGKHSFDNLELWSKDKLHITCVFRKSRVMYIRKILN